MLNQGLHSSNPVRRSFVAPAARGSNAQSLKSMKGLKQSIGLGLADMQMGCVGGRISRSHASVGGQELGVSVCACDNTGFMCMLLHF